MPFDFHNRDRIHHLVEEMATLRYRESRDIENICFFEEGEGGGNSLPDHSGKKIEQGFSWRGWDRYHFLSATIDIPKEWEEKEVIGYFDFGVEEGNGNNGDFESLMFLNETPYQAMDGNHKEVFLEPKKNGLKQNIFFHLWTGLSGGGIPRENRMELTHAKIAVLDVDTDDFYFLTKVMLETYDLMPAGNEYKEWMLNLLVKAFVMVDYTDKRSDAFYRSVAKANEYLLEEMDGRGKPDIYVNLIGHTHIDVAWLWRLKHTREKARRSFTTVDRLMEKYPDYLFMQGQPQLYEYIKEDDPFLYEKIKKRVKEGKWEPAGAMWVECDCNLASGESIIRQILVGKNFFKKEFDYESEYLWLPDVFGYSWALPQILKKSDVDTFMTTKISWNDTNRLPYDTFSWRGIDGTEVTAHFVTTTDPGEDYYTYNGNTSPNAIRGVWESYKNKDSNRDLLISFGYGDGGGGPTRGQIKQAEMADKVPYLPHVKMKKPTDYFRRLNKTWKENRLGGFLPIWDGELYLEFHRGTYTSQAYNKKMNRKMEYLLRAVETESVFASVFAGVPYNYETLLKAWKIVLCHQFHDILPGSSIKEVYEDSHVEYEKAAAFLREVSADIEGKILKKEEGIVTVFNHSNWTRTSIAFLPLDEKEREAHEGAVVRTLSGEEVKSDRTDEGIRFLVEDLPPFAYRSYRLEKEESKDERDFEVRSEAESPYYIVNWNEYGQLTRIYDKTARREVLPKGKAANVLQIFEDKPRCFDAWELEPTLDLKKEEIRDLKGVSVRKTPLMTEVIFTWKYHHSLFSQTMCLYEEKRRIDFKTEVDWHERNKLLKTSFPVDVRAVDARFDIQNGNIRRPITQNTSWEAAKFEVVAHKWVDLYETGFGLALLNDCKYGHDVKEDTIRLTLLRGPMYPDYEADQGKHSFIYSILPHSEEWYEAGIEEEAFDLNDPMIGRIGRAIREEESLFVFNKQNLAVDAIKREENGEHIILRFHEFEGRREEVIITTAFPVHSWCECNLMERAVEAFKEGEIKLMLKPYEIKTLMLKLKG